VSGTLP